MTLSSRSCSIGYRKQSGVVLIITLIVLVAMTLAAISLIRSVDTSNIIAGNLAFHSAATDAADIGVTQASAQLSKIGLANALDCDQTLPPPVGCDLGYRSRVEPHLEPPYPLTTWDSYWNNVSVNAASVANPPNGYTIKYIAERICNNFGTTFAGNTCSTAIPYPNKACIAGAKDNPGTPCDPIVPTYYRVTVRSEGPRNTVSYVQSIIAMF